MTRLVDILVILEIKANTGKVNERLNASLAELLGVTDTRALEDEWRAESTARDDDLLARPDDPSRQLAGGGERLGGNDRHANSSVALEDNLRFLVV